jgi:ornithine decarboxylase
MDYFRRFTLLFAAPVFDTDDLEGLRFNQTVAEIERSGFEVVRARKLEDAEIVADRCGRRLHGSRLGKEGLEGKTAALIIWCGGGLKVLAVSERQ